MSRQRTGTYAKRFCDATCRAELHTAARRYALGLLDAGFISIKTLKDSAACQPVLTAPRRLPSPAASPVPAATAPPAATG